MGIRDVLSPAEPITKMENSQEKKGETAQSKIKNEHSIAQKDGANQSQLVDKVSTPVEENASTTVLRAHDGGGTPAPTRQARRDG